MSPSQQRLSSFPFASCRNFLSDLFCAEEVDRDSRLKIICACLLFYFHMTFKFWWENAVPLSTRGTEVFNYAPASLFQNFRWLIFMNHFQTETYLYALGMLALLGLFSLFYLRSSLLALCLLAFLFINKLYFYLADFRLFTNYHHFHLLFTLTFLIAHSKMRFFRAVLALSYFMSAVVKLSPSWLLGEYFNSVPGKLPLLSKESWVVTSASVGLVVLEFLGPLCWFTGIVWLRRLSFGAFILFHIYSGLIVGFWYTSLMLPLVVAAFLGFNEPLLAGYRFSRRHWPTLGLFAIALLGSFYHFFIPGDARLTAEGRYFGLFMFDANRSVVFETEIQKGNKFWEIQVYRPWRDSGGLVRGHTDAQIQCKFYQDGWLTNTFSVSRPIRDGNEVIFNPQFFTRAEIRTFGDPYLYYFYARELVRRYRPDRVSIRLEQQLDKRGEVFTLLDIPDFADLNPSYKPLKHNDWILLPNSARPAPE